MSELDKIIEPSNLTACYEAFLRDVSIASAKDRQIELTLKYKRKADMFAIVRPFRVNNEQLELLEPIERIEIENISNIRPKKKDELFNLAFSKRADNAYKFTLLTDISNKLSSNAKLFADEDYLNNIVKEWMEIFLWFFEAGFYEDGDMLDVLRRVKETFKLFNEINVTEFVTWYSGFSISFIKSALFKIQGKLIKEAIKNKNRFKTKITNFLGKELRDEEQCLSFGKTLLFYKDFNKSHFRDMEEEINLLQEIYFNSTFGPNQLKTNYLIDWELQEKEVELQEYFFNIKDQFMTLNHVMTKTKINSKVPQDVMDKLKAIEEEFVHLMAPSHSGGAKLGNFLTMGMNAHALGPSHHHNEDSTPMISPNSMHVPQPDIGMSPKQVADILLGKDGVRRHSQSEGKKEKPHEDARPTDNIYSLFVSIPKLTAILVDIDNLINREDLKPFRTYIEVRTGSIIERATAIIKVKHQSHMDNSMKADEWEAFKFALSDIIFDSRIYLSMFSREFICYLVEVMPEHSIKELVKATIGWQNTVKQEDENFDLSPIVKMTDDKMSSAMAASRPYKQCFSKLIKAYYQWLLKNTQNFENEDEKERESFYTHATSVLKFFDRMVLYIRKTDPTLIQPEILYFDFLFSMYACSNSAELLRNYAQSGDKSPKLDSNFNNLFVRMQTNPASFYPESIHKESSADLKVDFIFLMALLSSMKLATNRFFTTEYSDRMKKGMDIFVNDLMNFTKGEDVSFQDSKDGAQNLIKDDKIDFGDGYLNLLFNEKQLQRDKNIQNFLGEATANLKMENKYYYMLYNLVVRLQTNILFNTDEALLNNKTSSHNMINPFGKFDISWRPKEDKLLELCKINLSPILSECFLSKRENGAEGNVFNSSIKSAVHQNLTLIKKFELASYYLDEANPIGLEQIRSLTKKLTDFKEIIEQFALLHNCVDKQRLAEIEKGLPALWDKHKTTYQNLIERIIQIIVAISEKFSLKFNPDDYRRESIHSDQGNLRMLSILSKHSKKYNTEAGDSAESYYKAILAGRVEMEIDSKELNMGLARSFIKIFNKMLLNQPNYKRRFRKITADIDTQVRNKFTFLSHTKELEALNETISQLTNERDDLVTEKIRLIGLKLNFHKVDDAISRIEQSLYRLEEKRKRINTPIDSVHQFLLAYETNYFYNEVYTKAIVLYEKLIDEIPELKGNIFNESYKNKGLINFEAAEHKKFERTYPYLHNLYTLSLQYSYHLMTSVVYNVKWGISMSRLFIILSVLNNLTLDNYQGFKEMFAEIKFEDHQLELFKEVEEEKEKSGKVPTVEKSPLNRQPKTVSNKGEVEFEKDLVKPLTNEAKEFEKTESFIVSICCRLERFLHVYDFYDRSRLTSNFDSKIVTTALPVLTLWLNFIDIALITEKTELMTTTSNYIYNKLFTRYLLRMLFSHEDISSVDVMYLKKSICSLLFKLIKNDSVMDDLLKYHSDLRSIYDYTIKITKVHIASLISNNPSKKVLKWLKRNQAEEKHVPVITEDKQVNSLIETIAIGVQTLAFKSKKSKYSFNTISEPRIHEGKEFDNLVKCNTNLFGGFNFSYIKDREQQKELEKQNEFSANEILECYKKSDNRDLGFQFINSLVKLMGFIEYETGLKLWSSKKETARVQFEVEPTKLPKVKLYELSIVYFLSMINKQIEVVDKDGDNVLINFRKYPEIYTLENLNPLELIGEFKFEDFKRDVCKIIPELYVKTNIQYNIQQKMGFWYMFLKSDTTKKNPVILWIFSVILNLVIIAGNVNPQYREDTHTFRNDGYAIAENVLAWSSFALSGTLLTMMSYTRYLALKISRKTLRNSSMSQVKKNNDIFKAALGKIQRIFNFFFDNPYYTFIRNLLLEPIAFQIFLHFTFTSLGIFLGKLFYSFGLLMFIFFSKTTRHVLRSISTNSDEIIIAVIIVVLMAYILTIIQFFYYYNTFKTDIFGNTKPCVTLYHCFMTTVNYGLRFGGGIAENTVYVPETAPGFEAMIVFDLVFFFFINIIGLNMVFGIIIDTFGELRNIEQAKEVILATKCLICGIDKTSFESVGINFAYHVKVQHNIEDYVAYLIRLNINKSNLTHEVDFYIFGNYLRHNVSWFPNRSTIFKDQVTRLLKEIEAKKQQDQEQQIYTKIDDLEDKIGHINESFKKIEQFMLKGKDSMSPHTPLIDSPQEKADRNIRGKEYEGSKNFFGMNRRLNNIDDQTPNP